MPAGFYIDFEPTTFLPLSAARPRSIRPPYVIALVLLTLFMRGHVG